MATTSLKKINPRSFDYWKAQHLLNRAGFGGQPSQVLALRKMGPEDAVDHLLNFERTADDPIRPDRFDATIMRPRTESERSELQRARRSGDEAAIERYRQMRQQRQRADRRQLTEIQDWWLQRMIETPTPMLEKLVLFWHGHFATGYRPVEDSYHMFLQNQLFRSRAAGNFKNDLVRGIIRDPAMIKYLNNNQNNRRSPNENLARELMELFTLGEGRGYTERDIKEGARALTGYTFQDDVFRFNARNHDTEAKTIFGRSGNWDGDDFIELIFTRPDSARFITEKLYRYFVNDAPGGFTRSQDAVIRKLAQTLVRSGWELRPLLRQMLLSEHFYDPENIGACIKSPTQLVVQGIRSLRTPARDLRTLNTACGYMGQSLMNPPSVKGWEGGRKWINTSTLFIRQNISLYLLTGRDERSNPWDAGTTDYSARHLVQHLEGISGRDTVRDGVVYLLRFAHSVPPDEERVQQWVDYVNQRGGRLDEPTLINLLALITAAPEYQLC
ncbi:MAG: DUF1800 domain-containing protein [Planctomycetota bacterium]|nr:DUF1800 domain-containing protein [Planctomycetota bacterium]